jgi:Tfp pilus assembly PilM family ATPase
MSRTGWGQERPERIILAGGGVYTGDLPSMVTGKTGIVTTVSDPFASAKVRVATLESRLTVLGSAFTTCFGLALRALEG